MREYLLKDRTAMRGYLLSMIEVCTRLGKPLEAESYREKLVELGEPDEL